MNLDVQKEDIKKIGYAWYNGGGFLEIMCGGDTCNIEEILLRSILKCFGDDYKVIKTEDFSIWGENGEEDIFEILFITNLPYELFEKI